MAYRKGFVFWGVGGGGGGVKPEYWGKASLTLCHPCSPCKRLNNLTKEVAYFNKLLQNSLNLLLLATSDYRSFFINIFIGCRSPVHQFFLFTKPKSNFLFCTFYWVTAMNNIPAQKKWNSSGLQNLWEDYVPENDSCLLSSLGDSLLKRPSDEKCSSPWGGALRDNTKNGCIAGLAFTGLKHAKNACTTSLYSSLTALLVTGAFQERVTQRRQEAAVIPTVGRSVGWRH